MLVVGGWILFSISWSRGICAFFSQFEGLDVGPADDAGFSSDASNVIVEEERGGKQIDNPSLEEWREEVSEVA